MSVDYIVTENETFIEGVGEITVYGVACVDEDKKFGCMDVSSVRSVAERFAERCRCSGVSRVSFFEVLEDFVADI